MKVVCAWCGAGKEKVRPGNLVSHGICGGCVEKVKAESPQAKMTPAGKASAGGSHPGLWSQGPG